MPSTITLKRRPRSAWNAVHDGLKYAAYQPEVAKALAALSSRRSSTPQERQGRPDRPWLQRARRRGRPTPRLGRPPRLGDRRAARAAGEV